MAAVDGPETWRGVPLVQEVIVIGTGFGGAVAACRLSQAGLKPLVLERGRRYGKDDFPALPSDRALLPDLRRWSWGNEQGLWDILDLQEVVSIQAAGYGGGSLLYANVQLRPPRQVFAKPWPEVFHGREALDRYFDLAGYMLDAVPMGQTTSEDERRGTEALSPPTKARQLKVVAANLGRGDETFYPPLAVRRGSGTNDHGRHQGRCVQCGKCCTGCPEEAKNTLDFNYLAEAERPEYGTRVLTECEVLDIGKKGGGGRWSVECLDHVLADKVTFEAAHVFLCAGSVHTTRLMARLARATRAPAGVGVGWFPGGGAIGVVKDTRPPLHPSEGPAITSTLVHWDSVEDGSYFLVQDGGYARELERVIGIFGAPAWLGRNRLTGSVGEKEPHDGGFRPPVQPLTQLSSPLPSPVDAALDALSARSFDAICPPQLRDAVPGFLAEVRRPLQIEQIVRRTIETSLDWMVRNHWLWRRFDPDGWVNRAVKCVGRCIVKQLGTHEDLADRALRALLTASGQPRADVARHFLGYQADAAEHRLMLLAMGRDPARGVLLYDSRTERLTADLDLFHLAPRYVDEEGLMADIAKELGGELRTNPAWAFLGKPVTVHNQGGCPMGDADQGVTDPMGKVRGHEGLYILDGAVLSTSVGVNPSATITALAEHNVRRIIAAIRKVPEWPEVHDATPGARRYRAHMDGAARWKARAQAKGWHVEPPRPREQSEPVVTRPLGLTMDEALQGYFAPTNDVPRRDADYRAFEARGRPANPVELRLRMAIPNLTVFFEDMTHRVQLRGRASLALPGEAGGPREHVVAGHLSLFVPRYKAYGLRTAALREIASRRLGKPYRTRTTGPRPDEWRLMTYFLTFPDRPGWSLYGYKRIKDDPGLDAWRDTTALFFVLHGPARDGPATVGAAGVAHVDLTGFLFDQIPSLRVGYSDANDPFDLVPTADPAQTVWGMAKFSAFFYGSLQRIYAPEVTAVADTLFGAAPSNLRSEPHPRR